MRALTLIPLAMLFAAGLGYGACRVAGMDPHARELLIAGTICLLAAELATVPTILARAAGQAAVTQAALVGTMVHLFLTAGAAAAIFLAKAPLAQAFVYWLLAFYWTTLIVLVAALVREVRTSPAQLAGNRPPAV